MFRASNAIDINSDLCLIIRSSCTWRRSFNTTISYINIEGKNINLVDSEIPSLFF